MRIQGHIAGGVLTTGVVLSILKPPIQVADKLLILGALAGSLPDWDILIYFLKKRAIKYDTDFHHHTWITHTFPFYLVPALILYLVGVFSSTVYLQWSAIVFFLAAATHLVQDMYGSGDGIMVYYPFSRKMEGFELTGTHGPEWMKQYLKSRAFRVEQATVFAAIIFVACYILFRIFQSADLVSGLTANLIDRAKSMNWLAALDYSVGFGYLIVVIYYIGTVIVLLLNVILQGILHLFPPKNNTYTSTTSTGYNKLRSSLALNCTLALISLLIAVTVIAVAPGSLLFKLSILPVAITAISYLWGWRTTTIGVVTGTAWTAISLWLFTVLAPEVSWWTYAPYFLILNLIGNLSGWLGGFVSCGQIREAECITHIEMNVANEGKTIYQLLEDIKTIISKNFKDQWQSYIANELDSEAITLAEVGYEAQHKGSVLFGKKELEWIHGHHPQLETFFWLLEFPPRRRRVSEIIDCVFNVHRHVITRVAIHLTPSEVPGYQSCLRIIVMTFRETPTIVWVDAPIVAFARKIHDELLAHFDCHHSADVQIHQRQFVVLRSWKGKPKIEQYAKNTWASYNTSTQAIQSLSFDSGLRLPADVVSEFTSSGTFFDRWRGPLTTFALFLASQVMLGIAINILSSVLATIH
jgi:hypothetical protein